MRKLIVFLAAAAALSVAACNTVAGMGKDTKAAGQAIENSADEVKN